MDQNGTVTTVAASTSTITAACNGKQAPAVTVNSSVNVVAGDVFVAGYEKHFQDLVQSAEQQLIKEGEVDNG